MPPDIVHPTYSRCPLVEALIDIQVDVPSDFQVKTLLKCQKPVKGDYPEIREGKTVRSSTRLTLGHEPEVTSSFSTKPTGYTFASADKKQLFQARLDGFTFNRLDPYIGWEEFITEAQRLWDAYRKVVHPREYKRMAVRYINQINIPLPIIDMQDYFRTKPDVASELPQMMEGFFFRVLLPLPEIKAKIFITQTHAEPPKPGQVSVILDLDLYRTENLPSGPELWPLFDQFRTWKNRVFEACITDRTRELIR